jgi:hypothetical protein
LFAKLALCSFARFFDGAGVVLYGVGPEKTRGALGAFFAGLRVVLAEMSVPNFGRDGRAANVAHERPAAARHLVTALFLVESGATLGTVALQGIGHPFFAVVSGTKFSENL